MGAQLYRKYHFYSTYEALKNPDSAYSDICKNHFYSTYEALKTGQTLINIETDITNFYSTYEALKTCSTEHSNLHISTFLLYLWGIENTD